MKTLGWSLFCFLLFALASCKDDLPTADAFVVSGKVLDTLGKGIGNIKVHYQKDLYALTNSLGNWQTGMIKDSTTIVPADSGYYFTPASIKVTHSTPDLVFTAHIDRHQNPLSEKVYAWFAQMQLPNGLLESTENSNFVSLYDNALAAMVFMAKGDNVRTEAIFDFFNTRIDSELLSGHGGFSQFRDRNGNPTGNRWLGDNAWLLMALNTYTANIDNIKYLRLTQELSRWIRTLQDTDGSVWGGYTTDGTRIGKVTEGMIDAFAAIGGYDSFHSKLLAYLKANRWEASEKLLISWPGNKYLYAMDNHSWGYCAFEDFPYSVLQKAERYLTTKTATVNGKPITGYCFDIDKDDVWLEGTGQMVVAFQKAGNLKLAGSYLTEMEKLFVASKLYPGALGIPYASNLGTGYATDPLWIGADTKPCISSGAWYLFGILQYDPFAESYKKNIPAGEKFWLQ
jgi:hypothetical protein